MSNNRFDLSKYVEVSPGVFERVRATGKSVITLNNKPTVKKGRSSISENPIIDSITCGSNWCEITLSGVIKGLNSSGGLMRSHWTLIKKEKEAMVSRIKKLNPPQISGTVNIFFKRYCVRLMDWDNMCSTAKLPFDAMVKNKVIENDSPDYIVSFVPEQEKCRRKDQRTVIMIRAVP